MNNEQLFSGLEGLSAALAKANISDEELMRISTYLTTPNNTIAFWQDCSKLGFEPALTKLRESLEPIELLTKDGDV